MRVGGNEPLAALGNLDGSLRVDLLLGNYVWITKPPTDRPNVPNPSHEDHRFHKLPSPMLIGKHPGTGIRFRGVIA